MPAKQANTANVRASVALLQITNSIDDMTESLAPEKRIKKTDRSSTFDHGFTENRQKQHKKL